MFKKFIFGYLMSSIIFFPVLTNAFEDKKTAGNIKDSSDDIIFSRIPVFHENIDNIIGMVYKDTVLETMADDYFEKTMADIVEPVESVYETESV